MKEVPDQPKCGNYRITARSNSIVDQYAPGKNMRSLALNLQEVSPLTNATIDSRSEGGNAHTHGHACTQATTEISTHRATV